MPCAVEWSTVVNYGVDYREIKMKKVISGVEVDVVKVSFAKKIKGTDEIEFQGKIAGFPETSEGLLLVLQNDQELLQRVRMNLRALAETQAKAKAQAVVNANVNNGTSEEVPALFSWYDLTMAVSTKKTATSMVKYFQEKIAEKSAAMVQLVVAGNVEESQELAAEIAKLNIDMVPWSEKKTAEDAARAASRAETEAKKTAAKLDK